MSSLAILPLAPKQLQILQDAGFESCQDVLSLSPTELAAELSISQKEALEIRKTVENVQLDEPATTEDDSAFSMLQQEESQTGIVTFSAALDEMIGGGIPVGKITEFCGAPGMGKTQFGMQLAVDVQIPVECGGLGGEAIYIDTEGSFIGSRVLQIAEAAVSHIHSVLSEETDPALRKTCQQFTVESVLNGIHVYRCHNYLQVVALSYLLPQVLQQNKKIKLIVIDSIAFHFRHDFEDFALRTRTLQGLVQSFIKMAHESSLAVVFMNQMTTKISAERQSRLIPALGESWGHACTIRIILYTENSKRYAHLYKSPTHQEAVVPYEVTEDGIRDVQTETEEETSTRHVSSLSEDNIHNRHGSAVKDYSDDERHNAAKRQRVT